MISPQALGVNGTPDAIGPSRRSVGATPLVVCVGFDAMVGKRVKAVMQASRALSVIDEDMSADDFHAALERHRPDAALLAWEASEAAELRRLASAHPHVGIVVLVRRLTGIRARTLAACGAAAALDYTADRGLLVAATMLAARGMSISPRPVSGGLHARGRHFATLWPRETELVALLDSDLRLAEIAATVGVTVETIKTQKQSIYRKLVVHSRDELRLRLARGEADATWRGRSETYAA